VTTKGRAAFQLLLAARRNNFTEGVVNACRHS